MVNSLTFLYTVFFVSIILYALTVIVTVGLVLPRQVVEAKISDRLNMLRRQLFIRGMLDLAVAVASILALTSRYFIGPGDAFRYVITTIIFLHALSLFVKSFLDFRIYHQDYSLKKIIKIKK